MRNLLLLGSSLTLAAMLASCGTAPKPPTVDESTRRPANSVVAIGLQQCKHDLAKSQLLATEADRLRSGAMALADIKAWQQALANMQAHDPQSSPGNRVHTVHFEFGSGQLNLPAQAAKALIDDAKSAPLIAVRGRTDGVSDTAAEARVARMRAAAVRDFLIAAGVQATRIRATYQPAGDHVADNSSSSGRALNRRVEIEIYQAAPMSVTTDLRGN
ncbi:OmpA family protein [Roseateles sp. LYH14W]|uniref:OmpA family protein n=1 Tax=Pelomonas parva TaxID=3299032 RepID=A0ABW7F7K3_9BURK